MVQIVINIEKKHLWIFIVLAGLFGIVGYVLGYGSNPPDPSVFGHTLNEIQAGTSTNPEYGELQGAVKVQGEPQYLLNNFGSASTVAIVDTGTSGDALAVGGPVSIFPRGGGEPSTDSTSLWIGYWEFRHIPSINVLCVNFFDGQNQPINVGYFDATSGLWVDDPLTDCSNPPP
jgi:hypothetical protein